MGAFINVRMVQANGMDLEQFQFDYDMSFGVTFLHADGTVLARYGSRRGNEEEAAADMTMEGLQATMQAVLRLHRDFPGNRDLLAGKQPRRSVPYRVPEAHPLLNKYTSKLDYDGKVAGSCIHCHQVRDSERRVVRDAGKVLGQDLLSPYPMPSLLGFEMDPKRSSRVLAVAKDSLAATAGLREGDQLVRLNGQAIVSLADIQWVLHHLEAPARLVMRVSRGEERKDLVLAVKPGWDHASDIAWRVSTWDLRRMALGGMYLVSLSEAERKRHGIAEGQLGLLAKHVGQYGDHGVAKRAGVKNGDVVVAFDGITEAMSESELLRQVLGKRAKGEEVTFSYRRDGTDREAKIRLQ